MGKPAHLIRTEVVISLVLRYGVILCGLVIASGLVLREIHVGPSAVSSSDLIAKIMRGGLLTDFAPPRALSDFSRSPDSIMAAGLLLLIILPVARVGMTILLFLLERDWPFFFITLLVFSVLLSSLFLGKSL